MIDEIHIALSTGWLRAHFFHGGLVGVIVFFVRIGAVESFV